MRFKNRYYRNLIRTNIVETKQSQLGDTNFSSIMFQVCVCVCVCVRVCVLFLKVSITNLTRITINYQRNLLIQITFF